MSEAIVIEFLEVILGKSGLSYPTKEKLKEKSRHLDSKRKARNSQDIPKESKETTKFQ